MCKAGRSQAQEVRARQPYSQTGLPLSTLKPWTPICAHSLTQELLERRSVRSCPSCTYLPAGERGGPKGSLKPLRQTPLLWPEGHVQQGTKDPPGLPASHPTKEPPVSWPPCCYISLVNPQQGHVTPRVVVCVGGGVLGITMIVALPRATTHRNLLL